MGRLDSAKNRPLHNSGHLHDLTGRIKKYKTTGAPQARPSGKCGRAGEVHGIGIIGEMPGNPGFGEVGEAGEIGEAGEVGGAGGIGEVGVWAREK